MTRDELKAAAVAMLDRAYIPYSHFPVGGLCPHRHRRAERGALRPLRRVPPGAAGVRPQH